jgi:hypothetical protein
MVASLDEPKIRNRLDLRDGSYAIAAMNQHGRLVSGICA